MIILLSQAQRQRLLYSNLVPPAKLRYCKTHRIQCIDTRKTDSEFRTFPSILYKDYPSSYTFCGTLPTTIAGVATCLNYPCSDPSDATEPFNSDSPVFAYPSHPPIPDTVQNISASYLALDPKGSTWDAVWSYDGVGYAPLIQPLMPDMGAWNCSPFGVWNAPASVLNTALYLTATSTSTEAGDEAGATSAPQASPSKEVPAPAVSKEPAKAEPEVTKASQILANPFGVEKAATTAQNPAPAPSSPIAVVPAPSSDQGASDNKAGSSTSASNPAPEKASSNTGTSANQAANDNTGSSIVPAANPASPQKGSSSVAPSPNQGANVNNVISSPSPANAPSSQEESSNNAAHLPISGLETQAATAVPAAAAKAQANVIITSTNAQGSIVITTSQVPGVIVTSTNAQGSQVVTTIPVVSPQVQNNTPLPTPVVVDGYTLTTDSKSQYVIAGQTLSVNKPIVLGSGASTTPVLLQASGIHPVLIIGSSTTTLNLPSSTPTPTPTATATATATTPPAITIGTQAITANSQGQYVVGSQTLTAGGEIIVGGTTAPGGTTAIGGTTVSLAPSATQAVVGTSTEGLAPYIAGGLGPSGPNGTAAVQFLGGAGGKYVRCWDLGYLIGSVGVLLWMGWIL